MSKKDPSTTDNSLRLRQDEGWYRLMFNNCNDAIFVYRLTPDNKPGQFIEVNDVACRRLGYTREELHQLSLLDIKPPEEIEAYRPRLERFLVEKQLLTESEYVAKDGRIIPVEINAHLFESQGRPTVLTIARDISQRRQAGSRLQKLNEKLAAQTAEMARLHITLNTRRVEEQETLLRLSQTLLGETRAQVIMELAVQQAAQTFQVELAAIALIDEDGQTFSGRANVGWPEEIFQQTQHIPLAANTGFSYAIRTRAPVIIHDEAQETRFGAPPWVTRMGIVSSLLVPMMAAGNAVGGLVVNSRTPRRWSKDEVRALTLIANVTAQALERARLDAALRKSEEQYRSLFDDMPVGLFRTTPDGRFLEVNQALVQLAGYPDRETMMAANAVDIYVNPEDHQQWQKQVARDGIVRGLEVQTRRNDGSIIWAQHNTRAVHDDEGRVLYYEGSVLDITERKQAEEILRANEKRFRALTENASDGIVMIGPDGRLLYVSPATARIVGNDNEAMIGRNSFDFIHPHDRESLLVRFAALTQTPGATERAECRFRHQDGSWRWVEATTTNLLADPEVGAIVSNFRDITERKRAGDALRQTERRYRNLFEHAPLIYLITINQDGVPIIVDCNELFLSRLGYERSEVLLRPLTDFCTPQSTAALLEGGYQRALEGRFTVQERQLVARDGRIVETLLHAVPDVDDDGHVTGTRALYTDITQRKKVEDTLKTRSRQQAAVVKLGRQALTGTDLSTLLNEAVTLVARTLDVPYCKVLELLPDGDSLLLRAGVGWQEGVVGRATVSAGKEPESQASYTLFSSEPVIVEDLRTETRFSGPALLTDHVVISGMSVIIEGKDRPFGVLGSHTTQQRKFSQDDIRFLQAVANVLAEAIERKRVEAERTRLFEQVRTGRERLQTLSRQLVEVQEAERRYIARELHDEIGQTLTGLRIVLEIADNVAHDAEKSRDRLGQARLLVEYLMAQVHNLSLDLRPAMLDDLGLLPALLALFERFGEQTGVTATLEHSGVKNRRFSQELETAVYRIIQEALTNVARHAGVEEVTVRLWVDSATLGLQVEDQGRGFDVVAALAAGTSSGLSGMKERANLIGGQLEVESNSGEGTRLTAELPLNKW